MVVVHSGKKDTGVYVCVGGCVRAIPQSVWQHVEVYEFLCLLRDFVDFFNFVFMFQVQ